MAEPTMGECTWPDPHPPHLWAEWSDQAMRVKTWACSGASEGGE